jgi:hypothetical protein
VLLEMNVLHHLNNQRFQESNKEIPAHMMQPLLDTMIELVQLYVVERTGGTASVSAQEALQLLDARSLRSVPVLYAALKQCLQGTEVT